MLMRVSSGVLRCHSTPHVAHVGPHRGSHGHTADLEHVDCRRMFETAVAVGVYHKSDNSININPDEKTVFQPGDQIVVLSNTGDSPSCVLNYNSSAQKEDSQA